MLVKESSYCEECGYCHPQDLPHNLNSSMYQYNFFKLNGVFPTWDDAMSHCKEEAKISWRANMTKVRRSSELLMD